MSSSKFRRPGLFLSAGLVAFGVVQSPPSMAGETMLVSQSRSGATAAMESRLPVVSPNGRYVLFISLAPNLVASDKNLREDLYIFDRTTGLTKRINPPQFDCPISRRFVLSGAFSEDGRYVGIGYEDWCRIGDDNVFGVLARFDQLTGTTTHLNFQGNSPGEISMSRDGRYFAVEDHSFEDVTDTQVSLYDSETGTTTRITSIATHGNARSPSISGDGALVAFESTSPELVGDDTNGATDVFLYARSSGAISRISKSTAGAEGNRRSFNPSISTDGQTIAYSSAASNLVPGDTNGQIDVFGHSRTTNQTTRLSLAPGQGQLDNRSDSPSLSRDGRFVAFRSLASNVVPNDGNAFADIFVRDLATGATTLVSKRDDGLQGNGASSAPSISASGRFIAFASAASNLLAADRNLAADVFLFDRQSLTVTAASRSVAPLAGLEAIQISINSNGNYIAFASRAPNLVRSDTNDSAIYDIFVFNRLARRTTLASLSTAGEVGNDWSLAPSISGDGQVLAYHSLATNFVDGDTNGTFDVFVRDRLQGLTTRVSESATGQQADGASLGPAVSADGKHVAFRTDAGNLAPNSPDGGVFVKDLGTRALERVDVSSSGEGANAPACGFSPVCPSISANGRYVAFHSRASNLTSGTQFFDNVYVRDRQAGTTSLASATPAGLPGHGASHDASISPSGRFVAFISSASDLVPNDTNGRDDVFERDRVSGQTLLVSVFAAGQEPPPETEYSLPSISADGRFVSFVTSHRHTQFDEIVYTVTFLHDRQTGQATRVDVSSAGEPGNKGGIAASISRDGRFLTFLSRATNLTPDPIATEAAFVHEIPESAVPIFDLVPTGLAFGNVPEGGASAAKKVTIVNTGPLALPISLISVEGSQPGQFSQTDDCPPQLPVGATCDAMVTFAPTGTGARSAILKLTAGAGGAAKSVALSGTGT